MTEPDQSVDDNELKKNKLCLEVAWYIPIYTVIQYMSPVRQSNKQAKNFPFNHYSFTIATASTISPIYDTQSGLRFSTSSSVCWLCKVALTFPNLKTLQLQLALCCLSDLLEFIIFVDKHWSLLHCSTSEIKLESSMCLHHTLTDLSVTELSYSLSSECNRNRTYVPKMNETILAYVHTGTSLRCLNLCHNGSKF